MSHGIIKPIDMVISTQGTEWHGLADVVEQITEREASPLFAEILEGKISIVVDGETVDMGNHKALVADYRKCRPDLAEPLVPLNIPRNTYRPIPNRDVWNAMNDALSDLGAKITCAGTLEAGKKFFLSADIGQGDFTVGKKDKFLSNLNFITSHDGTLAVEAYDSLVRIVCMNTLRWSRAAAGEVGFKVYHTQNASTAMANLGDLVNAVLTGREDFRDAMGKLLKIQFSEDSMIAFTAGWFAEKVESDILTTRSSNAVREIVRLSRDGKGNSGKTAYDLFNGATEYWTTGEGVGKTRGDASSRLYKANFGSAADHKSEFTESLMDGERRESLIKLGSKVELAS